MPSEASLANAFAALGTIQDQPGVGTWEREGQARFCLESPRSGGRPRREPFVGEAGRLLTKIIQAMGFEREQVYICNVLKCRPPGNRNPRLEGINVCEPFLSQAVEGYRARSGGGPGDILGPVPFTIPRADFPAQGVFP